jgi:UDP-N-acetylglucosamine acyltransferase
VSTIHPTAIIEKGAQIGEDARIGPWCMISAATVIGDGVELKNNVTTIGRVEIGHRTSIWPYAVLGGKPQITPYVDADTTLRVGEDCIIREHVTIHRGSTRSMATGMTSIGNGCYLMDSSHVGHDCFVGDRCILARGATLGGHTELGNEVYVGGLTALHQFTQVGRQAFVGGLIPVTGHIPPFALVDSNPPRIAGVNIRGLKRRNYDRALQRDIIAGFDQIFMDTGGTLVGRAEEAAANLADCEEIQEIAKFILTVSQHPVKEIRMRGFFSVR